MKIKKISFAILLLFFPLSGCGITSGTDKGDSQTERITERVLSIDEYPLTSYFQYETLDLSGLVVKAFSYSGESLIGEGEIVQDYLISDEEGNILKDGYRLKETGDFPLTISKDGYTSCTLSISVYPSSDFHQTLEITSRPKTSYYIGESFSSDGLRLTRKTTRRTEEGKKNYAFTQEDYQRTIDGQDANGYVFQDYKRHTLEISAQGLEDILSVNLSLSATNKGNQFNLNNYPDDSVPYETSNGQRKLSISNSAKNDTGTNRKTLYGSDEVKLKYTRSDYSRHDVSGWHYRPSTGNIPLLVIPIVRDGYESQATDETWERINTCFFGDSKDTTFESLRSYYYKSSFGKLNLTGGVTGYVSASTLDPNRNTDNLTATDTASLAQLAFTWARNTYNLNATDFDTDKDGTIDGRWIIYIHDIDMGGDGTYWGFTSTTQKVGTKENPLVNSYGWAGAQFLDEYCFTYQHQDINDAHVLIHETGHRMGLRDYYSYGSSSYSPLGGHDRRDHNVFDQNPYSKRLLGWITPNVVVGNVSTVTLNTSSSEKDSVLVIPDDDYTPEFDRDGKLLFNPFDEYLLVDCFANQNRNKYGWDIYQREALSSQGGRVYHVDSRLQDVKTKALVSDSSTLLDSPESANADRPISNSDSGMRAEVAYGLPSSANAYDEIRLISGWRSGTRYLDHALSSYNSFADKDLFTTGSTFEISSFPNQFNGKKFNSGKSCSYKVSFTQIPQL